MFRASTLFLLSYYIYRLIKPIEIMHKYESLIRKTETVEFKCEGFTGDEKCQAVKFVMAWIPLALQQIFEFTYFLSALNYDIYKYPTMLMVLWFIVALARASKNKNTKKGVSYMYDEMDKLSYKVKAKIIVIIDILYFGYMFYLVIFQ